jgi:hypothetical protein
MLHQTPAVESMNRIGGTSLGPNHVMVCFDQIKSIGPINYTFILAVFDNQTKMPVYFVTAEENPTRHIHGGPSHFLSIFDKPGHCTLAASDEFADPDKFFPEAMRLVSARFGVDLRDEQK